MSSLTVTEKQRLERELGMEGGYVLDFSNRTFKEFFQETVGVDIFGQAFTSGTGSKAVRMRAYWRSASDREVARVLSALLDGWDVYSKAKTPAPSSTRATLSTIIKRLDPRAVKTASEASGAPPLSVHYSADLHSQLIEISKLQPQARGYALETFLRQLFEANGLSPRAPFRLIGEQIDGSFVLYNETYLLEAKWQNDKTSAADLRNFQGKVEDKATWTRGVFISISGFTAEGLQSFGRGKSIICIDGADLYEALAHNHSLPRVLAAKVRRMAEEGTPFVPVRELF